MSFTIHSPIWEADDGNIKLNIINLQMLLGIKDPSAIDSDLSIASGTLPTLSIGSTPILEVNQLTPQAQRILPN